MNKNEELALHQVDELIYAEKNKEKKLELAKELRAAILYKEKIIAEQEGIVQNLIYRLNNKDDWG